MITRLRQAVDASGEVIFMTDRKGLFTFVNRQFEKLYGYTASEVVGLKTPSVLKSGEVQPDEYAALWQALTEGRTAQLAVVNRCKDGRLVNIEATASPVWDDGKTIVGFLAIQRDVTERALAEKERRFQQAVLSTERELTLDGILVVDDNAKVISYNRRFEQMWGIPPAAFSTRADEVVLQTVSQRLRDRDTFLRRVRELNQRRGEVSHDEVELADGRTFERYSAPMQDPDGRYVRARLVIP